jgi:TIR domain
VIAGAPKVFISYRREETAGHAGRLYDVVSSRFGDSNVFMDVDIAPGIDFVTRITEAVGSCRVLLVIIGPHWTTISRDGSQPRLAEPGDFVRLEVESGLRRPDVAVIPVLVAGAQMPDAAALPGPLRSLARHNAIELSHTRWQYDVQRLVSTLESLLADTSAVHGRPAPPPRRGEQRQPGRAALVLGTALVAAAGGLAGRAVAELLRAESRDTKAAKILDVVALRGLAWALVGAFLAVWLTSRLRTSERPASRLIFGTLTGALAGAGGAAIYALPRFLPESRPPDSTLDFLAVAEFAFTGALIGWLIGSLWENRGSLGLTAGLLAGTLLELVVVASSLDNLGSTGRIVKVGVDAAVIAGLAAAAVATIGARTQPASGAIASAADAELTDTFSRASPR